MLPESTIRLDPRTENLLNLPFGRWRVIAFAGYRHGNAYWTCECSCPEHTRHDVVACRLKDGTSQSCGCLRNEQTAMRRTTHGQTYTAEYHAWQQMFVRCYNPKAKSFRDYGARGISVCERWTASFEAFLEDMGPRPSSQHSLERVDNNQGYSPDNCQWSTHKEQGRNRRSNHMITHAGITQCITDWAISAGMSVQVLKSRLNQGWSMEEALTTPVRPLTPTDVPTVITYNGITQSLAQWAKDLHMSYATLYKRLVRGTSFEEAIKNPPAFQRRTLDSY
jgi:hypothetical protein